MDGQLTLEDISKALEIDTELSQNEAINPKDDRKKDLQTPLFDFHELSSKKHMLC